MRLLDRYILREILAMLGLCLCGLLLVYIAFDLISGLNRFQEAQLNVQDVAELYLVKIPDILVFILPITMLIALLYVVTNHARHNELTAMRAAGVSLGRICVPYLAVGFLLSIAVFAMNEKWVPDSDVRQLQIMTRHRDTPAVNRTIQNNLFFHNIRDARTWIIGSYNIDTAVMTNPKVEWREQNTNWRLIALRGERVEGVWTFFGEMTFSTNDLVNLESLATKLKHPPAGDELSPYLFARLSPKTATVLANYTKGANDELRRRLMEDFTRISRHGSLLEAKRFAGVKLSAETSNLIASEPRGTALTELNRMLLIDAYPTELSRSSLYTVNIFKGDASSNFNLLPYADTNLIAMPQFVETPAVFASESKFNNRMENLTTTTAEFPIIQLREYLQMRPDLPPKYKAWLNTQLQGRYATPWACFVAVLIAIPFGAASGRRNVFVGVASAIVICFVYFILLQLSLALGTGGLLPPLIAAWLPNTVFGVTGFIMILRVR